MSKITNLTQIREEKRRKEVDIKLKRMLNEVKVEIEKDPWPLIHKQQNQIIKLHKAIYDIETVIKPMQVHLESSFPIQPIDVGVEAIAQVMEVQDILKKLGL